MAIQVLSSQEVQAGDVVTLSEPVQPYDGIVLIALHGQQDVGVSPKMGATIAGHTLYVQSSVTSSYAFDIFFNYVGYFVGTGNDEVIITETGGTVDLLYAKLWHIRDFAVGAAEWKSPSEADSISIYALNEECDFNDTDPTQLEVVASRDGGMFFYAQHVGSLGDCAPEDLTSIPIGANNVTAFYSDNGFIIGTLDVADGDGIVPSAGTYSAGPDSNAGADTVVGYALVGVMPSDIDDEVPTPPVYTRIGQYAAEMRCVEEVDILTGGTASIDDSQAKTGNYSYEMLGADSAGKDFGFSLERLRCAVHFLPPTSGTTTPLWLNSDSDADTTVTFGVQLDIDNQEIDLIVDGSVVQTIGWVNSGYIEEDWSHWALTFDGPNGILNIWCNDVQIFEYVGTFVQESVDRARSGHPSAITGSEWADNFYIDSATGGDLSGRPPYIYFRFGLTNGPGTYANFTPNGDTPNWRCIDDPAAHDGDSTTNTCEENGLLDTVTITPIAPLSSPDAIITITAVIPQLVIKADEISSQFGVALLLYDGQSSVSGDALVNIDTTYEMVSHRFTKQPDGSDWDLESVNSMEYGYASLGSFGEEETHHLTGTVAENTGVDPSATATSTGFWVFSDGYSVSSNSFVHLVTTAPVTFYADWILPTDVTRLYVNGDSLSALDPSALTSLTHLWAYSNLLTSIDVSALTSLVQLWLQNNSIASAINLASHSALDDVDLGNNQITSLVLPTSSSITYLDIAENLLTTVDFSNQSSLTDLICGDNPFTSLDLSGCTSLDYFYMFDVTTLASLDLSSNVTLTYVDVEYNTGLTSLNLANLANVTDLVIPGNGLTSLDCSDMSSLTYLAASDNAIASADLSGIPVDYIELYNNNLNQAAVDQVLCDLDANGYSNGSIDITGNAIPSATGLACKTSLEGKGWSVIVDS